MAELAVGATDVPPRIGRHRVLGFLATGGMSELFLGREPTGRVVVIKRILPHLSRQSAFVSMFIDEARVGSMIRHKNVVEVYELEATGTDLFMVMELLEGENTSSLVRRLINRDERLGYGLAAHLMAEACEGLHAAHELRDPDGNRLNVVHRDVSPQNVFVTYDGVVKVLDFGIAAGSHRLQHTATGQLKGKFSYMSPEQCRGEPLDLRSDVFSLGVVLYELTTQRRLFSRTNELLVLKAVCEEPIARPSRGDHDYPPFLEDICMRALSRDRSERYPSARAMRDDLINAAQFLLGTSDPKELLAAEMQRLFADRIERKRSMLRHARAGTDPGELPSMDADESVVIPEAAPGTPVGARPSEGTPEPVAAAAIEILPQQPSSRAGAFVALVAALSALAVIGFTTTRPAARAPTTPAPSASATPAPPPVVTPVPPATPATPELIVLRIDSTPSGAQVSVDGEVRGKTPMELSLLPDRTAVLLEVRYRGYTTHRQKVARDKNRNLAFELHKKKVVKPADEGFHRFD